MKGLSIRFKITFWFTAALLLVAFLAYVIVFFASHQIIQKIIRDNLIETVEHNVDEIEFYDNLGNVDLRHETDYYCEYQEGYLEIDDDFLDQVNEVYTALYHADSSMLYGETPIPREAAGLGFVDAKVQRLKVRGLVYYVFDRELAQSGLEGLWLRGVVSEKQGLTRMSDAIRLSLLLLPLLVLVSAVGGSLLAGRMLRPIQEISASAARIGTGSDLQKRIELGEGEDELHQLADSFNGMIQRLEEAFAAERQFASDVSHELRTPVSVITAQCEFSLEEPRSTEEYEQALQVIQRQGRRMARLIHDMLDYTRLEMRADSYPREELDLAGLVRSVCGDLALTREKGIQLCCQAKGEALFYGNRQLLTRMLANLVGNAYRYGKEGGHILVSLECGSQGVSLSVADDGIGIAQEEQEKVFQRFYQADPSRMGGGTGLGLSMVSEIVRFHGGAVRLESKLGEGSCFLVEFEHSTGPDDVPSVG
ncbi:MAG: HAMP domain-containing histidine kinase [Lachnospiraceae bacterium]|jgi:signal transduction histidine kinase|nr:HAMP domain-containing histidine kinase [Lachnospiraceae bacterium]